MLDACIISMTATSMPYGTATQDQSSVLWCGVVVLSTAYAAQCIQCAVFFAVQNKQ
jgi:hypothetical protein